MIPYIALKLQLFVPSKIESSPLISKLRVTIHTVTEKAKAIVEDVAPGSKLKRDLTIAYQETQAGAVGEVWMPYQLKFTLPPGVKAHFIPTGGSYAEAAAIQLARGYPMRFYWERVGAVVYRWSVYKKYQAGQDWGEQVSKQVEGLLDAAVDDIFGLAAEIWGSAK